MKELRIHGRGGQGVVTLADLLAKGALKAGKEAQALPFFGVERRGAAVKACLRIDDEPILLRSMSYQPGFIALMHENLLSYARQEGFTEGESGAVFIVNAKDPVPVQGSQWLTDAEELARRHGLVHGGEAFINVPMAGACARVLGLDYEYLAAAIRDQWPGERGTPNLAAARDAYDNVRLIKEGGQI